MSRIRTGSLGLDLLLGGGWKRGVIGEIWGETGSAKTTLAEYAVWNLESGEFALWIPLGTSMPERGVNGVVARAANAEEAFTIMTTAAASGAVALIVVDSANGLVRQAELDGDPDYEPHPQREYRLELNALKDACKQTGTTVLFTSKPRDRDRQPVRGTGISEKAAQRVNLSIAHLYQDGARDISATVSGAHCVFPVLPGEGIDWTMELARLAVRFELIQRRGAWFLMGDEKWQGIKDLARGIEEDSHLALTLDEAIRAMAGI